MSDAEIRRLANKLLCRGLKRCFMGVLGIFSSDFRVLGAIFEVFGSVFSHENGQKPLLFFFFFFFTHRTTRFLAWYRLRDIYNIDLFWKGSQNI
jgi:hypothetical protein